jgi:adenosine deaminase
LGHGVRAAEDPQVLRDIVEAGVTLEICPLSNVALGVYDQPADVPLRTLLAAGTQVTLNADDPLIFGHRLLDQYESARHDHGLSDASLAQLATNSILASRASPPVKARLLAGVQTWLNSPTQREGTAEPAQA